MNVKVKWGDQWHDLSLTSGKIGILNITIPAGDSNLWLQETVDDVNYYYYTIQTAGITSNFSLISLLDYTDASVFKEIVGIKDAIKIVAYSLPDSTVSASVIYTSSGAQSFIYLIGGITDAQAVALMETIQKDLPISKDADGYTDISNLRQITKIHNKKDGQNITITYNLQGKEGEEDAIQDTIVLNENDFPVSGVANNVSWIMEWEGFD